MAGGLVLAYVLATALAAAWLAAAGGSPDDWGRLGAGQAGLWGGLSGAALMASRRKGAGTLDADFGMRIQWSDLLAALLGVGCQVVAVPALYFVVERVVGGLDVSAPARDLVDRTGGGATLLVVGVLVVLVAPVVEELFYRGLFLRSLAARVGDGWAVVGSSAVFGLSHFQLAQLPGLFLIGVVLALLAVRTGRLGPSILAHVGFNGVVILSLAAGG